MKIRFDNDKYTTLNNQTFYCRGSDIDYGHKLVQCVSLTDECKRERAPLLLISNTSRTHIDVEDSIVQFFTETVLENLDTNYVIPKNLLKNIDTDIDLPKFIINLIAKYECKNVILPIEWTDYYDYHKIYRVSYYHHTERGGLTLRRTIQIFESTRYISSMIYNDGDNTNEVEVELLGVAAPEIKTGWVVI